MKTLILLLIALLFCGKATAFPDLSPEALKANNAWEKQVQREFNLSALRAFLVQTITEQKQFDGVDLTASVVAEKWKINRYHRHLRCGSWSFKRDEKSAAFQLRYSPDQGERAVVLICERVDKTSFRLVEIKWGQRELTIVKRAIPLIPSALCFVRSSNRIDHNPDPAQGNPPRTFPAHEAQAKNSSGTRNTS